MIRFQQNPSNNSQQDPQRAKSTTCEIHCVQHPPQTDCSSGARIGTDIFGREGAGNRALITASSRAKVRTDMPLCGVGRWRGSRLVQITEQLVQCCFESMTIALLLQKIKTADSQRQSASATTILPVVLVPFPVALPPFFPVEGVYSEAYGFFQKAL